MSDQMPGMWPQIRLVAGREIRERGGSRSFKVSTILTLVIVLAIIVVPTLFDGDDGPTEWELIVIGESPEGFDPTLQAAVAAQDASIDIVHMPAGTDVDATLESSEPDAVLVDGTELVSEDDPPDGLRAAVSMAVERTGLIERLARAGLEPEAAVAALDVPPIEMRTTDASEDDGPGEAAAFIGVVALFIAINSYGAWVLTGVLEEKSSRVVEVIIATMPPRALLAGKVLGIGVLGISQLVVTAVVGLGAAIAFEVTEVPLDLVPALAGILVWFVLGFAFYAVGYAAAGSLVSRQEDAQSAASPLTYLVLAAYFISLGVVAPNPEGMAAKVLSFVPFIAPLAMPSRIAQGAAAPWEIVGSVLVMLLGIWLMVRLAARIYERSLLRTGAPIRIWTAMRELRHPPVAPGQAAG